MSLEEDTLNLRKTLKPRMEWQKSTDSCKSDTLRGTWSTFREELAINSSGLSSFIYDLCYIFFL